MTATLLDGKQLAMDLGVQLSQQVAVLNKHLGRPVGLAVVLVGDDPASQVYVRNKERTAQRLGIYSRVLRLPNTISQQVIEQHIAALNADASIDAFLVQLPLPANIDVEAMSLSIAPSKDADGLHPLNLGKLLLGAKGPTPCTPAAVMALLAHAGVHLPGKRAVVVGRSAIVGKPMALMLLAQHATVTMCHAQTIDLADEVARADVVVAAVGRPELIQGSWLASHATVIDVGINRVDGALVGDVQFDMALKRVRAITPVPGGVGPMTIAMLMHNTVLAAKRSIGMA